MASSVLPIASESDFDAHLYRLPPTCLAVIYFHAPWAEPCQTLNAILSALASTYAASTPPTISFLSLDAEEISDVSERYNVSQVPLVVLQKDGLVLDTLTGTDAAKLRSAVEKHAGGDTSSAKAPAVNLPPQQHVSPSEHATPHATGLTAASAPRSNGDTDGPAPAAAETSPGALKARLSSLVQAAPVMLFMKGTPSAPQCGFSRQTVALLREHSVRYGFFNILADDEVRQGLKEFSEWPTFPQLYVGGEFVGGLDIVSVFPSSLQDT